MKKRTRKGENKRGEREDDEVSGKRGRQEGVKKREKELSSVKEKSETK